jgi:DNA polymerase III delta prime subunit
MVSFLIAAKDKEKRIAYSKDFCTKQKIDKFDITIIEKDTSAKTTTQSIGIDEVKQMQKKIFFKPIKSETKAVIIEDAHLLTKEAQNALLKVLEEPPANTIIMLGSDTKEALLPTILSRCQVIELEPDKFKLTEKARQDLTEFIEQLPYMPVGDKLKKAELLAKDKDKALAWLEKIILVLREKTIQDITENDIEETQTATFLVMLRAFQKLHTTLKTTNVNPRFALENTFLMIQSDKIAE